MRRRAPFAERAVDDGFSGAGEDALRKRFGLGEQRPRPEAQRKPLVGPLPCGLGGNNIENGKVIDTLGMIESHAIGDATAAIVSCDGEAREAELLHDGDHLLRNGALGVWRVVRRGNRTAALAVAAKVGADDGKLVRQQSRYTAPHQVSLGKAVQQKQRRPGAVGAHEDSGLACVNFGDREIVHDFESILVFHRQHYRSRTDVLAFSARSGWSELLSQFIQDPAHK